MDPQLDVDDPADLVIVQECMALRQRVSDVRDRADRLRALADYLTQTADYDQHKLDELEGALGLAVQLRIEQLDHRLRGRRLKEIAVEVLAREVKPGQPIHYRDWYKLLVAAGYRVGGKDPLASFLAQINRTDGVEALGRRSGQYRLRAA